EVHRRMELQRPGGPFGHPGHHGRDAIAAGPRALAARAFAARYRTKSRSWAKRGPDMSDRLPAEGNFIADHMISRIAQHELDQLVDGDVNPDERRRLIAALSKEPDGWRRCALAFLEAQSWRKACRQLAAEPGDVQPSNDEPVVAQPSTVQPNRAEPQEVTAPF